MFSVFRSSSCDVVIYSSTQLQVLLLQYQGICDKRLSASDFHFWERFASIKNVIVVLFLFVLLLLFIKSVVCVCVCVW